ncbi:hypothetical protein [Chlorogloea sp. CCALA 695]|uniref:hypothetical protein n=1 Tax=Chlorogloea sp. CCALA 695 TaxID=2107693 RepID=UPI0011B23F39|nr:hypothetical protein [Chlorogloea sp. CCALA 695]
MTPSHTSPLSVEPAAQLYRRCNRRCLAIPPHTATLSVGRDSDDVDGYFSRGYVLNQKGDKRGALLNYNQVIKLDPQYICAYIEAI